MNQSATLILQDGTTFHGQSVGASGYTIGEIVFNTSMTGYQEILTDPSYSHQIVTLTYPHIGNVGTNMFDEESHKIHIKGLIIKEMSTISSNYRSTYSLPDYLKKNNIIAISNIDTRKLTRILRTKGSQHGCIFTKNILTIATAIKKNKKFPGLEGIDLAKQVSTKYFYTWQNHHLKKQKKTIYHVVVYDYGVKKNILSILSNKGCRLTIVPAETSAEEILKLSPNGIFLSNGPGDPRACFYAITAIKKLLKKNIPIFGICLGHQLLALANGAKIIKMKFGHHGVNHPVKDITNNKVMITSQNHNFTVDTKSIPNNIKITHISLFDNSLQGIHLKDKLAFSFQGHPEANPGPQDPISLFDHFIKLIKNNMNYNNISGIIF
ncbi:glutamine-hydrolyzing carbamoyl-phosphate synthase small subunit [Buchnera aphidicola]|uniref:glutamine-hydrolyzing carbamoyl-phosphate synthase small subunit n=1 Tax=Buchnera aphidicola TaxID=9 RepID=UPI00346499C4